MAEKILINAKDDYETRIAVIEEGKLVDFDSESAQKKPIKGNIYLARVVRIEPSLQAVFIEYGNEKNGFLPFSEIHTDYYKIPVEDKNLHIEEDDLNTEEENQDTIVDMQYPVSLEDVEKKLDSKKGKKNIKRGRTYNVQEVIHTKQVVLVQAIKDERGKKGASFTTYISLPGQYCVLMPNSGDRNGGISRRIQKDETRKQLKDLIEKLEIPEKMSLIIRTAGQERTKIEIKRDYEYLQKLWKSIKTKTIESTAPSLIHEEADILMRTIRDFYKKDVEEIIVDTKEVYAKTREFMKQLSPSGTRKIKLFKETEVSLFEKYEINRKIVGMLSPRVDLPSGGSIVIGQTEALVAIDVNSGKATKERHIDTTALKTNIEAAKEIARQLRLRDLSGLVVIDFIDMSDSKSIHQVEKVFKQETMNDHARIQMSGISQFGLLEMSRQRLRSSVLESYTEVCEHCRGSGSKFSLRYSLHLILFFLRQQASNNIGKNIVLTTNETICIELLNQKRENIIEIEQKYNCKIEILTNAHLNDAAFSVTIEGEDPKTFSMYDSLFLEKDTTEEEGTEAKEVKVKKRTFSKSAKETFQKNKEDNTNRSENEKNRRNEKEKIEKIKTVDKNKKLENPPKFENSKESPKVEVHKRNYPRNIYRINKDSRKEIEKSNNKTSIVDKDERKRNVKVFTKKVLGEISKKNDEVDQVKKKTLPKKGWLKSVFGIKK